MTTYGNLVFLVINCCGLGIHAQLIGSYAYQPIKEFSIFSQTWLISTHFETNDLVQHLDKLSELLTNASRGAVRVSHEFNKLRLGSSLTPPPLGDLSEHLLKGLQEEEKREKRIALKCLHLKERIDALRTRMEDMLQGSMINTYDGDQEAKSRNKRAFSFLGNFLKGLTGVATMEDIREIQNNMNKLRDTQMSTSHVIREQLSVLNVTKHNMDKLSKMSNQIIQAVQDDHAYVKKLSETMSVQTLITEKDNYFLEAEIMVNSIQFAINEVHQEFNIRLIHLQTLQNGQLPMGWLDERHIYEMLIEIDDSLPTHISRSEGSIYELISTEVIQHEDQHYVIMIVPLEPTGQQFNLWAVRSVATPRQISPTEEVWAKHVVTVPYFALSKDGRAFTALTEVEFEMCSTNPINVCQISNPSYFVDQQIEIPCEIRVLLQGFSALSSCEIILTHTKPSLPKLTRVNESSWVIASTQIFAVHIDCPSNIRYVTTKPPLTIIDLGEDCTASSKFFLLPQMVMGRSTYKIYENDYFNFDPIPFNDLSENGVWEYVKQIVPDQDGLINQLRGVTLEEPRRLDDLVKELEKDKVLKFSWKPQARGFFFYIEVIIIIIIAVAMIGIIWRIIRIIKGRNRQVLQDEPIVRYVPSAPPANHLYDSVRAQRSLPEVERIYPEIPENLALEMINVE